MSNPFCTKTSMSSLINPLKTLQQCKKVIKGVVLNGAEVICKMYVVQQYYYI